MHVASQLTIDGRQAPALPAQPVDSRGAPVSHPVSHPERLFAAPQTIRGQMVLTPSEQHAADRCARLRP